MSDIVNDSSLEAFTAEYDRILRAVKRSHESERRLIRLGYIVILSLAQQYLIVHDYSMDRTLEEATS